jgi:hypothetical protein
MVFLTCTYVSNHCFLKLFFWHDICNLPISSQCNVYLSLYIDLLFDGQLSYWDLFRHQKCYRSSCLFDKKNPCLYMDERKHHEKFQVFIYSWYRNMTLKIYCPSTKGAWWPDQTNLDTHSLWVIL